MGRGANTLAGSRLRRLAESGRGAKPPAQVEEKCELCGAPISAEHRHMLDLESRELMCACRACSTLFDRGAAGGGHFRLVGDRRLSLDELELDDLTWERLRIPVDIAFFFHSTRDGRVMAFYPSPMGPTESQLELDAWEQIAAANPVLATMEADVEALLVNRSHGARRQWLVPIEDCYALVGLIRLSWKGLSGGSEVWKQIATFFAGLDEKSKPSLTKTQKPSAVPASAAEGSPDG
jgi:hypothetical protein